ncbi:MAG: crossover junction endodeoxyribonuclease RuvC [Clostridia bacterium]|nr:crossover junction endodeoxyribonuclease RuvC [Clostridia bacterium]
MVILGIDPGYAIVGYGVIRYEGGKMSVIDYGKITTEANIPLSKRLKLIYDSLTQLIETFKPDVVAVEELFFNSNVKTAIAVGHARGVIILAAANKNTKIAEYTPLQIKQAVVGYGRADKNQVQQMVKMFLKLKEVPKPDDTADALAVAICHANSSALSNQLGLV